jgi:uncharacterized membrane protein YecN with MAPEG domain
MLMANPDRSPPMEFTALVTLLLLAQYLAFTMLVGRERVRHGIEAPACSGHPDFDRAYRVQMNTLEQLVIVLPALWITAYWFSVPLVAPLLGLGFFLGRILYRNAYVKDPAKRGPGMGIGMLCQPGLLLCGTWAVLTRL